jgi:hypothetical protein
LATQRSARRIDPLRMSWQELHAVGDRPTTDGLQRLRKRLKFLIQPVEGSSRRWLRQRAQLMKSGVSKISRSYKKNFGSMKDIEIVFITCHQSM